MIIVRYFQRRPRKAFSFSLEHIFNDIRKRLISEVKPEIKISKYYNDGLLSKLYNMIEACVKQGKNINHITGEVHYLAILMRQKRLLLTVLDCGMIHRKTGLAQKFNIYFYLKWPTRCARWITSISETTKSEIIHYTNCPPEKIVVIPVAVDSIYVPSPKTFNSEKPNILQVGTGYNKNLLRVIEALEGICCQLTIIGVLDDTQLEALRIRNIDYINESNLSQDQMVKRFDDCDILAFVSTFEGFGMPIIEANSIERVVITSAISSMPEVAGDSACLVDPYNVEEIRSGFMKLITDSSFRERLIENGKTNRQRFAPQEVANSYLAVYKRMVE